MCATKMKIKWTSCLRAHSLSSIGYGKHTGDHAWWICEGPWSRIECFIGLISSYNLLIQMKKTLVSDIVRLFDVLDWCSLTIIKPKMLLQKLWKERSGWDEPISQLICEPWEKWHIELPLLRDHLIPGYCCKSSDVMGVELHGRRNRRSDEQLVI